MKSSAYIFLLTIIVTHASLAQNLKRSALWEFKATQSQDGKLKVEGSTAKSAASIAGLKDGDQLVSVNNIKLNDVGSFDLAKKTNSLQ